jgi:hypothetical protein
MTIKGYIAAHITLMMSIFAIPDFDAFLKFYLGGMVVLISLAINALMHWEKLKQYVIHQILADVWMELFKKPEFRDLLEAMERKKYKRKGKRKAKH